MLARVLKQTTKTKFQQKRFIGYGLESLGLKGEPTIHRNLTYEDLATHEKNNNEGTFVEAEYGNTFAVDTGTLTLPSKKKNYKISTRKPHRQVHRTIPQGQVDRETATLRGQLLVGRSESAHGTRGV